MYNDYGLCLQRYISVSSAKFPRGRAVSYTDRANEEKLAADIKREKDLTKNHDFIMFTRKANPAMVSLIVRAQTAAAVFFVICSKMNRQNALVISFQALEEITGIKRQALSRAVALLERENWIQIIKIGNMNAYNVNSAVVWQSYGNLRHTVFNATIYGTMTEQTEKTKADDASGAAVELKYMPMVYVPLENKSPPLLEEPRQQDLFDDETFQRIGHDLAGE